MIRRLSYVACDICGGFPAQPGDDHKDARAIARGEGYARKDGRDICPNCQTRHRRVD